MNEFLSFYLLNTAASSFDILTTGLLRLKTGNRNEISSEGMGNRNIYRAMTKHGVFLGGVVSELNRRKAHAIVSLPLYGAFEIAKALNAELPPIHLYFLAGMGVLYAGAGILNLIPLAFNDKNDNPF